MYLVHSTQIEYLFKILKEGELKANLFTGNYSEGNPQLYGKKK